VLWRTHRPHLDGWIERLSLIGDMQYTPRLNWPAGRPRRSEHERRRDETVGLQNRAAPYAIRRLHRALERLQATDIQISSDLSIGDYQYASDVAATADPGACVHFVLAGDIYAISCDRFISAGENLIALGRHVEAMAALERHGVASAIETLQAFAVTPAAGDRLNPFESLGSREDVQAEFRRRSVVNHPDKPTGSHEAMANLTRARDEALRDLEARDEKASQVRTPDVETFVFENERAFGAMRAAEQFLDQRGFSYGENEQGNPRGVLLGSYQIARWSQLRPDEHVLLDGDMTGDMRRGPVMVRLRSSALARSTWPSKMREGELAARKQSRRRR
jgi:hypothetical protein